MTYSNPIIPAPSADPWVVCHNGFYFYCKSGDRKIYITKSAKLSDIEKGEKAVVWEAPATGPNSFRLWAPELHRIGDKWYIYYAADDGDTANHRMWVLESVSADPQGPYIDKGKIADSTDEWAIDGTVLQKDDGALYFVWSGWEVGKTAEVQVIYIAPMANPWTISGERVKICEPSYEWERHDQPVNEGPQILRRDEKIFIVYSASASWRSNYCMGMLANIDGNVLNPTSWRKSPLPVFSRNDEAGLYSVGHCSFTTSPDGSEDWLLYHGMADPDGRWKDRSTRMQKFTWNDDGTPHFGKPVADELELPSPSGEK